MIDLIWILLIVFVTLILIIWLKRIIINRTHRDFNQEGHDHYIKNLKPEDPQAPKPNIIIVFCDDLGFADISSFGATTIQTPNIDSLAKKGVIFNQFYASAPICSPSRAGLLTGRYPIRSHIKHVFFPKHTLINTILRLFKTFQYGVMGLPKDEITLPEALKSAGYISGLIGKWHLGDSSPHLPNDKGFDYFYGSLYSNDMKPYALYRNRKVEVKAPVNQENLTKLLTDNALDFIKQNKDKPFFLHYCQPFPHDPLHASNDFKGTSRAGIYGDAVQELDWSVGKILKLLDEEGLRDNTLIFFTSDNGPWHEGNPGYHRGRKNLCFEGGQIVPMIASWPGVIPTGEEVDAMAMNIDFFPTLLSLAGLPLPKDRIIDGRNIMSLLTKQEKESPHDYLYYFWGKELQAVRDREFKYHIRKQHDVSTYKMMKIGPFLFNLKEDVNESYNQISHNPEDTARLKSTLNEMVDKMKENLRGWKKN